MTETESLNPNPFVSLFFFLFHSYPAVLRAFGWAPPTITLYLGHALAFLEFLRDTPPRYCRLPAAKVVVVFRELKKLSRDVGRTILGHQSLVKQAKQSCLVAKESLAACQRLARDKIPSLLGKAVFGDNPTVIDHCLMEMADLLSLSLSLPFR